MGANTMKIDITNYEIIEQNNMFYITSIYSNGLLFKFKTEKDLSDFVEEFFYIPEKYLHIKM